MVPGLSTEPDDGAELLTGPGAGRLLTAAVAESGGRLIEWRIDHVDAQPGHSTTVTYAAVVDWAHGRRTELIGASARVGEPTSGDARATRFHDGDRDVVLWLHPDDPDLPGLRRLVHPAELLDTLNSLAGRRIALDDVAVELLSYRPRRRAVARVSVRKGEVWYVKAVRRRAVGPLRRRHELLTAAGVPSPELLWVTDDHLLVLRALPGTPLAQALFGERVPCTAEDLIATLDAMPPAIAALNCRAPWVASLPHYVEMVTRAVPDQAHRLASLAATIDQGLADVPPGLEPTHGDFHEGQVHVAAGRVDGLLDIDTVGPGRRADDLACMVAHLSTVQRMNRQQAAKVQELLATWVPVFDERVDPVELRLRASAIAISLATGPYRIQEPQWRTETIGIIDAAETLVRRAG